MISCFTDQGIKVIFTPPHFMCKKTYHYVDILVNKGVNVMTYKQSFSNHGAMKQFLTRLVSTALEEAQDIRPVKGSHQALCLYCLSANCAHGKKYHDSLGCE